MASVEAPLPCPRPDSRATTNTRSSWSSNRRASTRLVLPLVKPSLKRLADAVVASMRLRVHPLGRFDPLRIREEQDRNQLGQPLENLLFARHSVGLEGGSHNRDVLFRNGCRLSLPANGR